MISASFINHTLTQPVARVAEIADAKGKAAKGKADRILETERRLLMEDFQRCEKHFRKVSAYIETRRELVSRSMGVRILPDAISADVWESLDTLCRSIPVKYLEARLKVPKRILAGAYERKGMSFPSVHSRQVVPDASWVKTDSDAKKYIKELRALPGGCNKRFPDVIRGHIARAAMTLPIPDVAARFGISKKCAREIREEFKGKQEEKSEF